MLLSIGKTVLSVHVACVVGLLFLRTMPPSLMSLTFKVSSFLASVLGLNESAQVSFLPSVIAVVFSGFVALIVGVGVMWHVGRLAQNPLLEKWAVATFYFAALFGVAVARYLFRFTDGNHVVASFGMSGSVLMLASYLWFSSRMETTKSRWILVFITVLVAGMIVLIYFMPDFGWPASAM